MYIRLRLVQNVKTVFSELEHNCFSNNPKITVSSVLQESRELSITRFRE